MWGKDYFGDFGQLEKHHIFGGALRDKSEHYGLFVYLTVENHREGKRAAHKCRATAECLKRYGQEKVMREQGWSAERFIREFGKNYLEPEELMEIETEGEWMKECAELPKGGSRGERTPSISCADSTIGEKAGGFGMRITLEVMPF